MKKILKTFTIAAVTLAASNALAGGSWPQSNGSMWHVMIDFDGTNISVDAPTNPAPLEMQNYGETHTAPADALDGAMYNDQYGWLANGIFTPPANTAIWILETSATAGLETFEGGMRPMRPNHTYAPIFTDNATPWMWGGTMTHNWYTATSLGAFEATYDVYIGDLSGAPLAQYGSDSVTLRWNAVPTPGSSAVFLVAGAASCRRRR